MNIVWMHLLTVHVPVVVTPLLALYTLQSLLKKSCDTTWKKIFIVSMLLTIFVAIAYFTGPSTAEWLKTKTTIYQADRVENHAIWGRIVFVGQILLALLSVMGLSAILQGEKLSDKLKYIFFITIIICSFIMIYTAHLGGLLRRTDLWL